MTVSTVSSMWQLAVELTNAVADAMATTDAGAPDTTYQTLGAPAFLDGCAQAAVEIPLLSEGATNPMTPPESTGMRHQRGRLNLVSMVAYAIRCIPVTDANGQMLPQFQSPSPATLSAIAKAGYEDGWAIWNWVNHAIRNGSLFGGPCSVVHFDGGIPYAPEAGLGGWRFAVRVELDGYDPTGS
jgi:hypothetical protein